MKTADPRGVAAPGELCVSPCRHAWQRRSRAETRALPPCRRNQRALIMPAWSNPVVAGKPGKGFDMKRSVATAAVLAVLAVSHAASAEPTPVQCDSFIKLRDDAQHKAMAVRAAMEKKADRKDICTLVQRYYAAESVVVKFLEENKTWCGIPEQAIKAAKDNHEHTLKFRTAACSEAPAAKP